MRRRLVMWCGIVAVTVGAFVYLTAFHTPGRLGPDDVVKPAVSWFVAVLAWALAVLAWDLAVVWIEYVSQGRHLRHLERVWRISGPAPAERTPDERTPWWLHRGRE